MELGPWDWLGIGLVFLVLELIATGIFMFWVGLAAITVALIMFLVDLGWKTQAVLFAITTLGYVLGWSYFGRSKFGDSIQDQSANLNSRTMDYIGQVRPLAEPIIGGKGFIVIDDSRWVVAGVDLPEGALVKVISVNGSILQVEPMTSSME